jgi:predicted kinase
MNDQQTPNPLLIIISGLPGTGKSTLGRRLADETGLPLIYRDGLKETLFDSLGWQDREWSKKLGAASYALLYHVLEALLRAGRSLIVESNFNSAFDTPKLHDLTQRYRFTPFQIQCVTEGSVLLQRFRQRSTSSERHPGHVDYLNVKEFKPGLAQGRLDFLDLGGTIMEIDTTNFDTVDYAAIVAAVRFQCRD